MAKDLFSANSELYQQARPQYSTEILDAILTYVPERALAWDCGAGSGQFTQLVAPHFAQVLATDLSEQQLQQAPVFANVRYLQATAEHSPCASASVDLVCVAQAIHWFNFTTFYAEVKRVLKPEGVLAVIGYGLIQLQDVELQYALQQLYFKTLQGYWDPERRYIDEHYQTIPFPFQELAVPTLALRYTWSSMQLLRYLATWSGVQHYQRQHQQDPLQNIRQCLVTKGNPEVTLSFPVLLRVGRQFASEVA
jgi:ubiquinone/menaquinone biosynthesis C-methylase UbiE